ncbi:hypothetical protein LINGRAHAP2_LOCUS8830 [Linum grandiflorum]
MLPTANPADTQASILSKFKDVVFQGDPAVLNRTKCGSYGLVDAPTSITLYFGCNSDRCEKCYKSAVDSLTKHCRGVDGAYVSSEYCCLRYEIYGIC